MSKHKRSGGHELQCRTCSPFRPPSPTPEQTESTCFFSLLSSVKSSWNTLKITREKRDRGLEKKRIHEAEWDESEEWMHIKKDRDGPWGKRDMHVCKKRFIFIAWIMAATELSACVVYSYMVLSRIKSHVCRVACMIRKYIFLSNQI